MITSCAMMTAPVVITILHSQFSILHWFNKSLIHHAGTAQVEALRQVLQTAVVRLAGNLRHHRIGIFIVDRVLVAHQFLALAVDVGTCQMTFAALTVVELEGTVQLQVLVGLAEAAVAVAVPQDAVVLVREHKGDTDLGVILEQVLVLAFHVELLRLMLSETVERLVLG